ARPPYAHNLGHILLFRGKYTIPPVSSVGFAMTEVSAPDLFLKKRTHNVLAHLFDIVPHDLHDVVHARDDLDESSTLSVQDSMAWSFLCFLFQVCATHKAEMVLCSAT